MIKPLQLCYPVTTLDHRELLPAGAELTPETMNNLVRAARKETFPLKQLMEHGTIAKDLLSICEHPPYDRFFCNSVRTKAVFETLQQVKFVQPLLDIYEHFKTSGPYTYRHILTVYALSLLLGQEMVSDSVELARVASAAPHHDFGKICVPVEIRKKIKPLNEQERHYLSHHAAAGYVLLSYYYQDSSHPAAITARDHHERRNATGYPRGIEQQNSIVEIVAVCDLFDALISPRPYRPISFDLRTALDEITQLAVCGAVSSDVVRILINCVRGSQKSYKDCLLSHERRGNPPDDNLYRGATFSRSLSACDTKEIQRECMENSVMDVSD